MQALEGLIVLPVSTAMPGFTTGAKSSILLLLKVGVGDKNQDDSKRLLSRLPHSKGCKGFTLYTPCS